MNAIGKRKERLFAVFAIVLMTVIGFVVLEGAARYIWKQKYNERLESRLHGYDMVDYERSIMVPIPNTVMTANRHWNDLKKFNKPLGLKALEQTLGGEPVDDSEVLFTINSLGFKGPEIEVPKPESTFRILTIGDSCTFNPARDSDSYPRHMERKLRELADTDHRIEIVNGALPGYNIERVNLRIDELLAAEPDLVTIYIGWNRTIGRAHTRKNLFLYRNLALYKLYYHGILNRRDTGLQVDFQKTTFYDPDDPELDGLESYSFEYDVKVLEFLVNAIKEHDPTTRIVLITLGGMMDHRLEPSERALEVSYPTHTTENLYAWPLLTAIFNNELRVFAERHDNVDLIDFETHAYEKFRPRDEYFKDSVHPSLLGYRVMGEYFARELLPYVPGRSDAE